MPPMEVIRQTDDNIHTNGDLDGLELQSEESSPQHVPSESVSIRGSLLMSLQPLYIFIITW